MSLKISNLATDKQKDLLRHLEYNGRGKFSTDNLTREDAALLIDELLEEQRLADKEEVMYTKDNKW